MPKFVSRTTGIVILPEGETFSSDNATSIAIINNDDNEEVVIIEQDGSLITVTPKNWAAIRDAVEKLVNNCNVTGKLYS
jgi:hypothetical protein